jgi:transaldolase
MCYKDWGSSISPYSGQNRLNADYIEVCLRIGAPVESRILEGLVKKFAEFQLACPGDGIPIEGLDVFGATRRTLRQFLSACHDLHGLMRDILIPKPEAA